MKSVLMIGMGRFGHHLCRNMAKLGNEIMIVDENEEQLEDLLTVAVSAKIGDCTNPVVLESLGVSNFDICFVCIGTNFQSSLEITSLLKEMGAKYVISKATRDIQAKFLLRNGADEVIYPERDMSERAAIRFGSNHIFDYIGIDQEFSIYEITPLREWIGKSIRELDIRNRYHISILGTKEDGKTKLMPPADYVICDDEHLMVIGRNEDVQRLIDRLEEGAVKKRRNYR